MYYPNLQELKNEREVAKENLAIQLYGKRIYEGQTVGEYLLEFLLVFIGSNKGKGGLNIDYDQTKRFEYFTNPNIGLKRFIFFENSKNENRHEIDREASHEINRLLEESIETEMYLTSQVAHRVKDLFYGFSLITKQRSWFAQSMMPLSKELVFAEAQNNTKRKAMNYYEYDSINKSVDKDFAFTKHSFLGRGGEVYYLHLLQGLQQHEDYNQAQVIAEEIEKGINDLLNSFPQFKILSTFILSLWSRHLNENMDHNGYDSVEEYHRQKMECHWIKANYSKVAPYTLKEIRNILRTDINPLEKLELLNTGIILQIFRLMVREAYFVTIGEDESSPIWLIQVPAISKVNHKVKMMAVKYYSEIENYMTNALSVQLEHKKKAEGNNDQVEYDRNDDIKSLKNAYTNSHKLLRKLGKEIGLIVPITGRNMRMSLNDDIMRFFVLALIEPGTSITLDSFLSTLYEHYGIVIREEEYSRHYRGVHTEEVYAPSLIKNLEEFVIQLRNNGYLRELSDATAIVYNPYGKEDFVV